MAFVARASNGLVTKPFNTRADAEAFAEAWRGQFSCIADLEVVEA
jgi:hypothetical protein